MKTFDVKHSDIVNFENILEADKTLRNVNTTATKI